MMALGPVSVALEAEPREQARQHSILMAHGIAQEQPATTVQSRLTGRAIRPDAHDRGAERDHAAHSRYEIEVRSGFDPALLRDVISVLVDGVS